MHIYTNNKLGNVQHIKCRWTNSPYAIEKLINQVKQQECRRIPVEQETPHTRVT